MTSVPAALAFPIGFDSQGIPTGLQFAALPGSDSLLLSLAIAVEKLFGPLPPPAPVAGCSGCTSVTTNIYPPAFNGTVGGQPNATDTWTYFALQFNGTCASDYLTNYGKSGELSQQAQSESACPADAARPVCSLRTISQRLGIFKRLLRGSCLLQASLALAPAASPCRCQALSALLADQRKASPPCLLQPTSIMNPAATCQTCIHLPTTSDLYPSNIKHPSGSDNPNTPPCFANHTLCCISSERWRQINDACDPGKHPKKLWKQTTTLLNPYLDLYLPFVGTYCRPLRCSDRPSPVRCQTLQAVDMHASCHTLVKGVDSQCNGHAPARSSACRPAAVILPSASGACKAGL